MSKAKYYAPIALIVLLIIAGIAYSVKSEIDWQEFKVEHNCEMTGEFRSRTYTTTQSVGDNIHVPQIHTVNEDQWKCDDGKYYWR